MISIASWAPTEVNVKLFVDWKALGLNPDKVKLTAPPIKKFQEAAIFLPGDNISVEPTKGWLLIAEEQ
jgi:hypothetical protein